MKTTKKQLAADYKTLTNLTAPAKWTLQELHSRVAQAQAQAQAPSIQFQAIIHATTPREIGISNGPLLIRTVTTNTAEEATTLANIINSRPLTAEELHKNLDGQEKANLQAISAKPMPILAIVSKDQLPLCKCGLPVEDIDKPACKKCSALPAQPTKTCCQCKSEQPITKLYKVGDDYICREDCTKDPIHQARRMAKKAQEPKQAKVKEPKQQKASIDNHILIPGEYGRSQESIRYTIFKAAVANPNSSIQQLSAITSLPMATVKDACKKMVNDGKATLKPV